MQRGCAAWASAAVRFIKPRGVTVFPHRLSRSDVVTGHDFLRASLLLRVKASVLYGEGGPTRPDRATPHFYRRRANPISFNLNTTNDSVTLRTAKTSPI